MLNSSSNTRPREFFHSQNFSKELPAKTEIVISPSVGRILTRYLVRFHPLNEEKGLCLKFIQKNFVFCKTRYKRTKKEKSFVPNFSLRVLRIKQLY
jgi:hypothetical protein